MAPRNKGFAQPGVTARGGVNRPVASAANAKTETPPARGQLSSVGTAIALLKAFSEDETEIGVSSLARRLGVSKSTVHRLAMTLVSGGLLEQNPESGRYALGIGLFQLGALVRRRLNISSEARPYLFQLREMTGETVHLAILDGIEIMYVYNLESPHAIRMRSDIGIRKPSYCTAEGLAMLAFLPETVLESVVAAGMKPRTPKTNTNARVLRRMLADVRQLGYAIEDEQSEEGMRSVAAPVREGNGKIAGAIGVAGPLSRMSDAVIKQIAPHLLTIAETISIRIGYRSSGF
jgi:IclR family transcriptional regulator, KDG regulon repressor